MTGTPRGPFGDGVAPVPVQPPRIDSFGVLRHGTAWVSLSPTQEAIMRPLLERLGKPVGRPDVLAATWPSGAPDHHAIDVHIHRLRPRLEPLGLVLHTLRGRGFLLETLDASAAPRRK